MYFNTRINVDRLDDFKSRIIDIPFKQYIGCYLLYYKNELVYVGVSCDIARRLNEHRCQNGKTWDFVKYIEEDDYLNAIKIENYFIDTYKPKYNLGDSKLKAAMRSFKDRFDENTIPYSDEWAHIRRSKNNQLIED